MAIPDSWLSCGRILASIGLWFVGHMMWNKGEVGNFCNLSEQGRRPDTLESATGTQKEKVLRLLSHQDSNQGPVVCEVTI